MTYYNALLIKKTLITITIGMPIKLLVKRKKAWSGY